MGTLVESNSHLIVVLGDFNIKSENLFINERRTREGVKIEFVPLQYGLHQIINEPTHVLENSSSFIDLICISQPNLVVDSGVYQSLRRNFHHQIAHVKFNFKIHFSLPNEQKV